ncbi:MAG: amidase [Rhodospirillaceae bacterium]|nr:amidase [Rhodospirillaceae bacterium]
MKGYEYATISQAAAAIRVGATSAVELTRLCLARVELLDGLLNAFITVSADAALDEARQADRELAAGRDRGPLHGIPVAIKDLVDTRGVLTTYGSRYYSDHVPEEDAAVITRLRDAGAVFLGKTGLHELAFGTTSVNPSFGAIGNPWRPDHHPGGSSGGSAVAVAAGMAFAAIGTDTGCSIRLPAQCCGGVGHKPTYGLVSAAGVLPLVPSMDHVGPMTRSVRDAALMLKAIAACDENDPGDVSQALDNLIERMEAPIAGGVIGVPADYFFEGGDKDVKTIVKEAIGVFEELGARVESVKLPDCHDAYDAANATFSEVVDVHREALADDIDAFSEPLRARYSSMTRYSPEAYEKAQRFRKEFTRGMEKVLERVDVLAMPTATVAAAPIAEQPPEHDKERRKNACIFDFTGQPSISVPCGFTGDGLPVGLMICGGRFRDARVLRYAHAFEQATSWHARHPSLP